MTNEDIRKKLTENGLKITPQRIAILEAIIKLDNHPTVEGIIDFIRKNHPNVAIGTVYNVLDVLTEKGLVKKMDTDKGIMRYDAILEKHHHLYCVESDRIEDYFDDELNNLIKNYLVKQDIPNFKMEDIKLQIIGEFIDKRK